MPYCCWVPADSFTWADRKAGIIWLTSAAAVPYMRSCWPFIQEAVPEGLDELQEAVPEGIDDLEAVPEGIDDLLEAVPEGIDDLLEAVPKGIDDLLEAVGYLKV